MKVVATTPLQQFVLGVRFELEKHLRRQRLLWALLLATVIPALFYVVPRALGSDLPADAEVAAANIVGFSILLIITSAAFFAGDALSGELDKRTYLTLYLLPQRRSTVVASKFVAALLATWMVVAIFYGIVTLEGIAGYGIDHLPAGAGTSLLLAMLFGASCVGLAFVFSSFTSSSVISSLLTFFSLLLIIPILSFVALAAKNEPTWALTYYEDLITTVLGATPSFGGPGLFTPEFGMGVRVWSLYAIVGLLLSRLIIVWRHAE